MTFDSMKFVVVVVFFQVQGNLLVSHLQPFGPIY